MFLTKANVQSIIHKYLQEYLQDESLKIFELEGRIKYLEGKVSNTVEVSGIRVSLQDVVLALVEHSGIEPVFTPAQKPRVHFVTKKSDSNAEA